MRYLAVIILLVTTTWAFCAPAPTNTATPTAAPKQYQVEMIVFSQLSAAGLNAEKWPLVPPFTLPTTPYTSLLPASSMVIAPGASFNLLPASQFKMTKEQLRLKRNPNYTILLHAAWIQSVPAPGQAKPIYITNQLANNATPGTAPVDVSGLMTLNVQRFFNAYFNLTFTVPTSTISALTDTSGFTNIQGNSARFHLLENRRMRSNELNYIDYPLFGILIEIFPVTAPSTASH
jgi:hypothetical protein